MVCGFYIIKIEFQTTNFVYCAIRKYQKVVQNFMLYSNFMMKITHSHIHITCLRASPKEHEWVREFLTLTIFTYVISTLGIKNTHYFCSYIGYCPQSTFKIMQKEHFHSSWHGLWIHLSNINKCEYCEKNWMLSVNNC